MKPEIIAFRSMGNIFHQKDFKARHVTYFISNTTIYQDLLIFQALGTEQKSFFYHLINIRDELAQPITFPAVSKLSRNRGIGFRLLYQT